MNIFKNTLLLRLLRESPELSGTVTKFQVLGYTWCLNIPHEKSERYKVYTGTWNCNCTHMVCGPLLSSLLDTDAESPEEKIPQEEQDFSFSKFYFFRKIPVLSKKIVQ